MNERDTLRLIDTAVIRRISSLVGDPEGLWEFILENLETLRGKEDFSLGILYALPHGMEHFRKNFDRSIGSCEETIPQQLIKDLGFVGEPVQLGFHSRYGYLDHPSSVKVETSENLIPVWGRYSEAQYYYDLFDVLTAEHLDLIAATVRKERQNLEPENSLDYLKVETMAKAVRSNPDLRGAYIYDV